MPTYRITEAELVGFAGTDAAMYLRVQHFGKSLVPIVCQSCTCSYWQAGFLRHHVLQAGSYSSFAPSGAASFSFPCM